MKIKQSLKVICLGLAGLFVSQPAVSAELRVLLIDGISNHNSELRVDFLRGILAQDPDIDLDISLTPSSANSPDWANWRPNFEKYDVVISAYNDIGFRGGLRWPTPVEEAFVSFIEDGGGFMSFHEANNAFDDWPEYNEIIGLGWRSANQGDSLRIGNNEQIVVIPSGTAGGTGHGPRRNVVVTRRADQHPIYRGLPDRWMAADLEVYRYSRGPNARQNVEVLTYARDVATGFDFPIEWATSYGEGRVYVSSYGHVWHDDDNPDGMRDAAFQTIMLRALYWLGGQTPSTQVPQDFPGTNRISLRGRLIDESAFPPAPIVVGNTFGVAPNGQYTTHSNVRTDSYSENIVINEADTYTNTSNRTENFLLDDFYFRAAREGDAITPFIVRVNGDNDFTVLAVGDSDSSYTAGAVVNKFSERDIVISVARGETIATGFIDSAAPNFFGQYQGSVAYTAGGDEIYYGGSVTDEPGGSAVVGQRPETIGTWFTALNRNYFFDISFFRTQAAATTPIVVPSIPVPDSPPVIEPAPAPAPPVVTELIVNGGFEFPTVSGGYSHLNTSNVLGWTDSNGTLEFWNNGFRGVNAQNGSQFAELNGAGWNQSFQTTPGSEITWSFYHKGRSKADTMVMSLGAPGRETPVNSFTTNTDRWVLYRGVYTVPAGQRVTRISFNPGAGEGESSNFLDSVSVRVSAP